MNAERLAKDGKVVKDNFNKRSYDPTTWYSMPDHLVKRAFEDEGKYWFDVDVAIRCHSIVAATIYQHLRYQLLLFLADNPGSKGTPYYRVNKAALARIYPWSLSTIKRAFTILIDEKVIAVNPACAKEYAICHVNDLIVPEEMRNNGKIGSTTEMGIGSSTEKSGSSTEQNGSTTEKNGSTTENYTHYKPLRKHIHKHHSPTAVPKVSGACADVANAANGSGHQDINQCFATVTGKENKAVHGDFIPTSLKDLRSRIAAYGNKLSDADKELADNSTHLAECFVRNYLDYASLKLAATSSVPAEIISAIAPRLHDLVEEDGKEWGRSEEIIALSFYRNLELVVGAFLNYTKSDAYMMKHFGDLIDPVWEVYQAIPDPFTLTDVPAEDKADLVIDTIKSYNADGWPTGGDGDLPFNVDHSKQVHRAAVAFFQKNPKVSAKQVWLRLSDCIEVHELKPRESDQGFDEHFHARKGVNPIFLFKYWETICPRLYASGFKQQNQS